MRRTTCSLLLAALVLSTGLVGAGSVAAQELSQESAQEVAPTPVAPGVVELAVTGVDPAAAAEPVDGGLARAGDGRRTVLLTGRQATAGFGLVGVTWRSDPAVTGVEAWARTRTDGAWSTWTLVGGAADEAPDGAEAAGVVRTGTTPLWVDRADGVQVRVDVLSGADPADLRVALVDPGASPADAAEPRASQRAAGAPVVRSRAAWGADESIRRGSPSYASSVRAVVVHHTASTNDYAPADVPRLLRGFYAYHVKSNGWSDIGYNLLVDRFGTVWEGRAGGVDRAVIGSHAGGFNTGTVGISMIGTYEDVAPSAAQREAVAQAAAWRLASAGVDPRGTVALTSGGGTKWKAGTVVTLPTVLGHRQVSSTSCPGTLGFSALPGIRDRAAALSGGAAPVEGGLQLVAPSSADAGSVVELLVRGGEPGARVEVLFARRGEAVMTKRRDAVLSDVGTYRTSFTADDDWTVMALSDGSGTPPAVVRRRPVVTGEPATPAPPLALTGPVTAVAGATVPLTATGPAGSQVSVWFRRDGDDVFVRRRTGTLDASGLYRTSYVADVPHEWFAMTSTVATTVGRTTSGAVPDGLHVYAPDDVAVGRTVPLVVQGAPGAAVEVWFARRGESSWTRRRAGVLAADGTYRTSYVANVQQTYFATVGARSSTRETTRVAGAAATQPAPAPLLSLTAPSTVEAGAPVPVVAEGPAGAAVSLWARRRGATTFTRVREGAFDATGRFTASYAGVDDHELWVASGGLTSADGASLVLPVLSGPTSALLGSRVVLAGRARPGDQVVVESRRRGVDGAVRTALTADAAGAFRTTFSADDEYVHRPAVGTRLGAERRTTVAPTLLGPAAQPAGSTVVVTGTARPGATVQVLFRREGSTTQVGSRRGRDLPVFRLGRTLVADAGGRYRTTFVLAAAHSYLARSDGNTSPVRATTVR